MKILFENLLSQAILSATDTNTNYPIANLYHPFLRRRWQSNSNTDTITIDATGAVLINSIYLGAGNVVKVNATPVADYENNRMLRLKARPFLRPASNISFSKQNNFFKVNAIKRFKKKGIL